MLTDYSKLELFRQETEAQITLLKEALLRLRTQPFSLREIEQATQAVHAIWGTAKILKISAIANLSQLVKECFLAAQNKTVTLSDDQIDVLFHAADLLLSMSKAVENEGDFERWMNEHSWDLATTQKAIFVTVSSGKSLQQSSTIQGNEEIKPVAVATQLSVQQPDALELVIEQNSPPPLADIPVTETAGKIIETKLTLSENPPATFSGDSSMMDLFRLEAEAQVAVLNEGLLALESSPESAQALETLMRAAHSIKGSARIVSLDEIVKLAHVMEDCFVAAQNRSITLSPDRVDALLHAVDLLQGISQISDEELSDWFVQMGADFAETRATIAAILNPDIQTKIAKNPEKSVAVTAEVVPTLSVPSTSNISEESTKQTISDTAIVIPNQSTSSKKIVKETANQTTSSISSSEQAATQDRVVRVSAENLNRIMSLAGESLIEANWLQPYADSMMSLKRQLSELSRYLEQLQNSLDRDVYHQEGKDYLEQGRNRAHECFDFLSERLGELELYAQRTANLSDRLYREVITSNMRPFADGVQGFPRMIRDLARKLNKQVKLDIIGKSTPVDRDILKKLEAPLTHILRNATDHGIELPAERIAVGKPPEGTIRLEAFHRGGMLAITIADDGKGINPEQLRQKVINKKLATADMVAQMSDAELLEFLFLPGFSTAKQVTEISGRGVGLDIAKSMAQEVGGTVRATSHPGKGTSFHFQLPLTLSVVRTLLVEISGKPYAVPLARIDQIVTVERANISEVENRQYFTMNQQNIGLIAAHQVLELPEPSANSGPLSVVVISDQSNPYGLVVDKFLGERDLVVRPLDPRLGKVPDISATSLMGDGSPILIVDVSDMVRSIDAILNAGKLTKFGAESAIIIINKQRKILVVDDSITVREMERKLLENRGYLVDIAVNGMEGWSAVRSNRYDLVITDIDMPRMNGIELVKQMRSHPRLHSTPVIIVSYRDREEDRIQGLEAGADYYLTKSSFHDDTLIDAVVTLIGR
ncbi:response regulator [Floridanema aerugineum]|uniref:histidine kinase n=1 Tax=Floridaenema aerugineum BLCC-F46 TaxID=3153654 RepID=A0ABV4XEJ1_9CYAN